MTGKITQIELCGFVSKCMASPASYAAYMPSARYRTPSAREIAEHALRELEAARQKDVALHEANLEGLERNKGLADRLRNFMEEIGMPRSYSERDHKSRSRYPKNVTSDAGWVSDIRRFIRTDDGFIHATSVYERLKRDYDAYAAEAAVAGEKAQAEATRKAEAEKAARRANVELARIVLRYALPDDSDWNAVLHALRVKDQRIDLALAMMATRADWNEGPHRVSDALSSFTIQNDEDKDIAADIVNCLHDFCDGRVFRDTSWNYDRLLASVADRQLVADALTAYQQTNGA